MVTATAPSQRSTPGARAVGAPPPPARPAPLRARPIPVAAYPAGMPRWVTYDGRRQRVLAVREQAPLDPRLTPVPPGARRMQVELAGGRTLTLVHNRGGWFERSA